MHWSSRVNSLRRCSAEQSARHRTPGGSRRSRPYMLYWAHSCIGVHGNPIARRRSSCCPIGLCRACCCAAFGMRCTSRCRGRRASRLVRSEVAAGHSISMLVAFGFPRPQRHPIRCSPQQPDQLGVLVPLAQLQRHHGVGESAAELLPAWPGKVCRP